MAENKPIEWSTENRLQMLQAITRAIPPSKKDNTSYHTRLAKLDWSSIQIPGFSPDQVKSEFNHLIGRVRRMRTLNEILGDLYLILKPSESRSLSATPRRICMCPHKKLNLFQWFSNRKRNQVKAQNPDMPPQQLMRDLGAHFRAIDPETRAKYETKFAKHLAKVDRQMAEYRAFHPDFFCPQHDHVKQDRKRCASSGPSDIQSDSSAQGADAARPRLPRPVDLYVEHKLERKNKGKGKSESEKKALRSKYKAKFDKLSDRKRLKWIERVATQMGHYSEAAKEYKKKDAKFKPHIDIGAVLTTREKELFDEAHPGERIGGRFVSGYNMFSREMYDHPSEELTQVAPKERMRAIAALWKALAQEEREVYNQRAEVKRDQSNQRFGIEPGRRRASRIAAKTNSASSSASASAPATPVKPGAKQEGAGTSTKARASKTKTKASQKAATSGGTIASSAVAGTKKKASAKLAVDNVFGREGESGDDSDSDSSQVEEGGSSSDDEPEPNANLQKQSVSQQAAPAATLRAASSANALSNRPMPPLFNAPPSAIPSLKEEASSSEDDDDEYDDPAPLIIATSSAPSSAASTRKSVPAAVASSSTAAASRSAQPPRPLAAAVTALGNESSSSEASGSETESESEQEDALLSQVAGANMAYTQFVAQTLGRQTTQLQVTPSTAANSAKQPLTEWSALKQPTGRPAAAPAMSTVSSMSDLQAARKHKPHTLPTMVASEPIFAVPPKKSKRQEQPVA